MKKSKIQFQLIDELAFLWLQLDVYDKAEKLYMRNLELSKDIYGENHLDTAVYYKNLAYVYGCQGNYEKGKELYKRSLQILEDLLEKNHLDIAESYQGVAYMYLFQEKYKDALAFFMREYKVLISNFGLYDKRVQSTFHVMESAYLQFSILSDFIQWLEEQMKESNMD